MSPKHEAATENFYGLGVEKFGDYHGRYLNFGCWDNGTTDYIQASERLLSRVAEGIHLDDKSVLLDVACGMGTQDTFFMEKYQCKSIEALDLTTKHIEIARQHNQHPRLTFTQGNACQVPFNAETFSHVIGIEGPANFNTRKDFLKEAFRVLKPGGYIGLSDYSLARKPKNWWERLLVKSTVKVWHMPYENAQTNEELLETLHECGYINAEVEVITNDVIPGYLAEQRRPECKKEVYRIRGQIWGRLSDYLDDFVGWLHKRGLVDYILVRAKKPDLNETQEIYLEDSEDDEMPDNIDFSNGDGVRGKYAGRFSMESTVRETSKHGSIIRKVGDYHGK